MSQDRIIKITLQMLDKKEINKATFISLFLAKKKKLQDYELTSSEKDNVLRDIKKYAMTVFNLEDDEAKKSLWLNEAHSALNLISNKTSDDSRQMTKISKMMNNLLKPARQASTSNNTNKEEQEKQEKLLNNLKKLLHMEIAADSEPKVKATNASPEEDSFDQESSSDTNQVPKYLSQEQLMKERKYYQMIKDCKKLPEKTRVNAAIQLGKSHYYDDFDPEDIRNQVINLEDASIMIENNKNKTPRDIEEKEKLDEKRLKKIRDSEIERKVSRVENIDNKALTANTNQAKNNQAPSDTFFGYTLSEIDKISNQGSNQGQKDKKRQFRQ